MSRKIWHLGNTTVRSPFRLRDGLTALSSSSIVGNLRGEDQDIAFRELLGSAGIVDLGVDETNSVGRKWRSALSKLGFLVPEVPKRASALQSDVGNADTISENGKRLIDADSVPAIQECFLRSLTAYVIPNPAEHDYDFEPFSPLKYVLSIMLELEKTVGNSDLSTKEIAFFVEATNPADGIASVVSKILKYRSDRKDVKNKKAFDNATLDEMTREKGLTYVESTYNDYADTTTRYLKATGVVVASGRGITIFQDKKELVEKIVQNEKMPKTDSDYYKGLCAGAQLPTDDLSVANENLEKLKSEAHSRNVDYQDINSGTGVADINIARLRLEERISESKEKDFAVRQESESSNILYYIDSFIQNNRGAIQDEDKNIYVSSAERPAYFEWILWRAFLAIDNLLNQPFEARRFSVDQAFLPINPAPGNGPDMIFEFNEYVLVVEATLTENSRQEAAEGETVRRHVADIAARFKNKSTYGLFIAKNIDTNTASTFLSGNWYTKSDEFIKLSILPVTLEQFRTVFNVLLRARNNREKEMQSLIDGCLSLRDRHDAPGWKNAIKMEIDNFASKP